MMLFFLSSNTLCGLFSEVSKNERNNYKNKGKNNYLTLII